MNLKTLPREHPLRNRPLVEIGAEYLVPGAKNWKPVHAGYKIARKCFNDLGPAWTDFSGWRAAIASGENHSTT